MKEGSHRPSSTFQGINSDVGDDHLRQKSRPSVTFQGICSDVETVISDKEVDHHTVAFQGISSDVGTLSEANKLHSRELAAMWKRSSQAKKQTISYIPGN